MPKSCNDCFYTNTCNTYYRSTLCTPKKRKEEVNKKMNITSDGVRNVLNKLQYEKTALMDDLKQVSVFVVSVTENKEDVRPDFDLNETAKKIEEIDKQILQIRHARNVFNATTIVADTGLTVDEVLIRMAMLNSLLINYTVLASNRERERVKNYSSNEIEYRYVNYEIQDAKNLRTKVEEELRDLQQKLNYFNSTETFEIPL
jgi:hypothetical protein